MIERFKDENGGYGLRMTAPDNDRVVIDGMIKRLKQEEKYLDEIERLKDKCAKYKDIIFLTYLTVIIVAIIVTAAILGGKI